MNNFFHEIKRQNKVGAIVTLVLGVLLFFSPFSLLRFVVNLLGLFLLISGVIAVISAVTNQGMGYGRLFSGVVRAMLGLWLLRNPGGIFSAVAIVVGILLLVHAVNDLQYAWGGYQAQAANWVSAAVSGGISLILALLVLVNPFRAVMQVVSLAGLCLIINGVSDLIMMRRLDDFF